MIMSRVFSRALESFDNLISHFREHPKHHFVQKLYTNVSMSLAIPNFFIHIFIINAPVRFVLSICILKLFVYLRIVTRQEIGFHRTSIGLVVMVLNQYQNEMKWNKSASFGRKERLL